MLTFPISTTRNAMAGVVLVTLLAAAPLRAEEPSLTSSSTLGDYVAYAIANNPGLRAEYDNYRAALEKIPQARSLPDPKVMATHFVEDIQTRTGPQENQVFVSQMFPWFGKLRLRGQVASKEAEALHSRYEAATLNLARDLSLAYYDYGYLREATEITREVLNLLEQLEEPVREKVRGGADLSPLLRLEVEIGKAQDILQGLEKQRRSQSAALDALLGRRDAALLPFPKLPDPTAGAPGRSLLIQQLLADNPELHALQRRVEKAETAVKLSKLSPIPDPTIGAGVFDTGEALNPSTVGSGDNPWAIQIGFSIPLWNGKYKAEKREARARLEAAQKALTDHENMLLASLTDVLQEVSEVDERLRLYEETLLPKARQAFEVTEESYRADRSSILDLIDSERTLLEIERTYWRAVADHYKTRVRLETLTGKQPK